MTVPKLFLRNQNKIAHYLGHLALMAPYVLNFQSFIYKKIFDAFRLESWMKNSKKSMHKSDETTNCLLQQLVTINRTLENLISQQK